MDIQALKATAGVEGLLSSIDLMRARTFSQAYNPTARICALLVASFLLHLESEPWLLLFGFLLLLRASEWI